MLLVVLIGVFLAAGLCVYIISTGDKILVVPVEFSTIAQGMEKAKGGYTVLLNAGSYSENITLKSHVTLKSEEGGEVVITNSNNKAVITVEDCNNVVIENIGTGRPRSLLDFAQEQWSILDAKGSLIPGYLPYRTSETMRYVPLIC